MPYIGRPKRVAILGQLSPVQSAWVIGGVMFITIAVALFGQSLGLIGFLLLILLVAAVEMAFVIGRVNNVSFAKWAALRTAWRLRLPLHRWQPVRLSHTVAQQNVRPDFSALGWSVARVQANDRLGVVVVPPRHVMVATIHSSALATALSADPSYGAATIAQWEAFLEALTRATPVTHVSVTTLVAPLASTATAREREVARLISQTWPNGVPKSLDRSALIQMVAAASATTAWIGFHVDPSSTDYPELARSVTELGQRHLVELRFLSAEQIVWECIARIANPYDWADQVTQMHSVTIPSPQALKPGYDALLIDDTIATRTATISEWPGTSVEERWWLRVLTGFGTLPYATVTTVHIGLVPPSDAQPRLVRLGQNANLRRILAAGRGKIYTPSEDVQASEVDKLLGDVKQGATLADISAGVTLIAPRTMPSADFASAWREVRDVAATHGIQLVVPGGQALEAWRTYAFPFGEVRYAT